MTDIKALRDRIEAACERALEAGYSITDGDWGIEWLTRGEMAPVAPGACLCPLACIAVTEGDIGPVCEEGRVVCDQEVVLALALGVPQAWVAAFVEGFDDDSPPRPLARFPQAHALGAEMRRKYLPVQPPAIIEE